MIVRSAVLASRMRFAGFQRRLVVALFAVAFAIVFPHLGSAQQITYNDFNAPQANSGQTSTNCAAIPGGPAAAGVLFCFNYTGAGLSYFQDFYPPQIDPNASTDGDAGSTDYAVLLTEAASSQISSMWYSTPQNVAAGFDVWYAVKLTPETSIANCCTADGLAFVIQNAAGGQTDSITNSPETGSGLTVLGAGGGSIGYGGIDNSVALEMDTFYDSAYDPYDGYGNDDNHIALQSCGPGIANSPAHISVQNCLITLNGTTTLVSNPGTSAAPPATASSVYLADGNPHQIVMVYNGPNDSPANYLTVYLDPAMNAGTQTPVAGSVPLFSGPFDITKYINLNKGTAYVGFTAANGYNFEQHELMGFTYTPHGYGIANVCPTGQTTPAPCSSTLPETFNFAASTTIGSVKVVTQGTTGLDFQLGSGSTCTAGTISAGSSCTVNVNFAPLAPGLRMGAVEILDPSGNLLASRMIYGIGKGPEIAFSPSSPAAVSLGGSYSLSSPVAVDAAGNIYFVSGGQAYKKTSLGVQTLPSAGEFFAASSMAVDGAGDVFIADSEQGQVFELPANGGAQTSIYSGVVYGFTVDGSGDIFVADYGHQEVVEIPANGGSNTVVYGPSASGSPNALAVDGAGDLFIALLYPASIVEVPAGCSNSTCQTTVGTGWNTPSSLAVDAAGDLFVADPGLASFNGEVVEVTPGCSSSACQYVLANGSTVSSGVNSYGLAVDGQGNVYYVNTGVGQVYEISRSQPPSLSFPIEYVGTNDYLTQSFSVQNVGNQTLNAVNPGLVVTDPNFLQVPGSGTPADCTSAFALSPGVECNISITFDPLSGGNWTGTAALTDNSLNEATVTQSIALSGVAQGSSFGIIVTEIGSGTGTVTDNQSQINCSQADGVVTGTCTGSYAIGSVAVLTANATGTSTFVGWSGACASAGANPTCNVSSNSAGSVTANFVQPSFGPINVCSTGQTSPAPCNSSLPETFTFAANTTVGSVKVVTQGITGLDFQLGSGNTCIGNIDAGNSCSVNVTFAPLAPGLRLGAVELFDTSGNLLATNMLSGIGQGAAITFAPGVQTTEPTSGLDYPDGVAVDAAGNLFIADYVGDQVVKVTPGGVQTTVPATGLNQPVGVAVDGAGDVFIVDLGLTYAVKLTPSGVQTSVGTGLGFPIGVAVDGVGDVFIGDQDNRRVVEVTPTGVQTALPFTGLQQPWGVAVDSAGDVFVADGGTNNQVEKITPVGVQSTVNAVGLQQPYGVAVDAAGDVFIGDPQNGRVVEVPANGGAQTTVGGGLSYPSGVAVDGAGDVFIGDQGQDTVFEVNRSQPPALSFQTTNVGNTSTDSPQTLTIQNVGNQTLSAILPGLAVGAPNFYQVSGSGTPPDCSFTFSLAAGAVCDARISFIPQVGGNLTSTAVFTDNSFNGAPATQTIALSGVAFEPTQALVVTTTGVGSGSVSSSPSGINCIIIGDIASGMCQGNYPGGEGVSLEEIPYSGFTFVGWGGACASAGTSQFCNVTVNAFTGVIANFAPAATNYTIALTEIGSGAGTVTDNQAQINCSEANGATTGTCNGTYGGTVTVTLTASATGTSAFLGWGGACASAGTNPTCIVSSTSAGSVTASFVQQNYGNVNVCQPGETSPAPCSSTMPITLNLGANTTIGAIKVVTQGATGLDFTLGSGSTCTGTISAGNSCIVNVNFAPLAPGLRVGAVQLFDNAANLISTTQIYGIGEEPEIAFGPGTQTSVLTSGLSNSTEGLAVDAAGNVYIADYLNNDVVMVTPGGTQTTVTSTGLNGPYGVAVDGAGDVFIANSSGASVVEVTPAGVQTTVSTTGFTLNQPYGVALDAQGDLYIADTFNNRVVEVPATGGNPTTLGSGLSHPVGLAVDFLGNVYIGDTGNHRVVKEVNGAQLPVNNTVSNPSAVAVDAAGDVFIGDWSDGVVVEVTPGSVETLVSSTPGGAQPYALALDGAGDVFIGNSNVSSTQVVKISRSQPVSLSFAVTNTGSTSTDSPKSVTVQNIGNQPLAGKLALSLGGNFTQNATTDCSGAFPLAPSVICSESFSFTPQSASFLSGTAAFSDNTLNSSPQVSQTINLSGTGAQGGQPAMVSVPDVVGQPQAAAATPITVAGLALGVVSSASSNTVPSGSVISESPAAGTQVSVGTPVSLLISSGIPQPPNPNPLTLENNYFVTGDYVSAGVTLRGTGTAGGMATGTITIPNYTQSATQGIPDGADIIDAFLYWETLENTPTASSTNGTFDTFPISGQQIGNDLPNYTDGAFNGTLRSYRADVNAYFAIGTNGVRFASGTHTVSLPDGGGSAMPLTEGASLVIIYRVLSPNFPLKSVVIYDGAAIPTVATNQVVQGFYDAVGGANGTVKNTTLFAAGGAWNNSVSSVTTGQSNQFNSPLNPSNAYAAVIVSTPVNNSDNDGILDAWKTGPGSGDFHAGQPGYYDVKTGSWVSLPGAKHGEKDLFVQLDYMCGAVLADGSCDPTQENLFPSPDVAGNDPLAMVQQAFAASGVQLHLEIGNAVPETTCQDNYSTNPPQLCQFPNQPGVIGWKNSLEFSKLWPRNLAACASGGDCTARFPYGQKDSYHYVLVGHSLAIPAYNTRYGTLTSIQVVNGVTTIVTADRGTGTNSCPSRITISGVLGNPSLNGVYNTTGCPNTTTITAATPGVPNWTYPNTTLPEPVIGLTSGTITSISGYSDLGGADSAVTLGLWLTAPNQDMSKKANVVAGTLFHEIGHTLGLSHGGLYYDTPNSYVPTFEANCKPNLQSIMNYLFQLDGVGPNASIAFSNQALTTLLPGSLGSVTQLTDSHGNAATFPTSAWYTSVAPTPGQSPATLHCDGAPLTGDTGYRVDGPVAPITPAWTTGQNITFDPLTNVGGVQEIEGMPYTQLRGYNEVANLDLRQVGATGGEFASLASVLSFGSSASPLNISPGGSVALGSGGTIALGSGGTVTLGSGGNVTLGSGGTITLGSGGNVTLGSGGNVTLGSGGTIALGSGGTIALGSGGNVTLGSAGTITLGSGGTITLGSGGNVTLGSGGTIALGSGGIGGTVTIPSTGGSYTIDSNGGTITLGSGGNVTLGSGGNVTLGSGGTIALGSGGNITLGSGGNVTLGSGGTITLGSGGNITLGSGGNVTLGSGGTITLGSGGTVTLGSGGNVTLGSGGTVTLGSGGVLAGGSGGNITLGSGGNVTLGSGGTITLGSGGNVTLGSGGNVTLGSGGTITLGSGGTITLGSGVVGSATPASGGASVPIGAGGSYTFIGGGGTVTLGSGGNVTLGSGGTITLGSGGTITLGSGGNVTLGSGGVVTLGSGGNITLGSGGTIALGSGGTITLGSGGALSTELTYDTANSVVRAPSLPTETPTSEGVRVDWTAPAFGVVATYSIYRSSDGETPILIGSVSGVNGFPPATEFIDTNPDLTSATVVYTISTVLVPDTTGGTQRQSPPSPPAVLKNDQSITLGPLPSSVAIPNTITVTATAMSSGNPNGLQVNFSASGSCAIGSQSIASNVSSATVTPSGPGACTIIASQPGTNAFNAADAVSGTVMILPQGSSTMSQTINFAPLQDSQYGNTFTLSASSSAGLPVSFTASGQCTASGVIKGVGQCSITASAPADSTHSAASLTQTFTIFPAVLKVTATSISILYGQPIPSLTYTYSGFVNHELSSVVNGAPALSTTATPTSIPGSYPITVSTGTLSAANYSFLYVSGTLTVQSVNQAITFNPNPPTSAAYNSKFTVAATGGASGDPVIFTSAGSCSNSGATYTMTSGTGACSVIANQKGNSDYGAATQVTKTVNATRAIPTVTFTGAPANAAYNSHFTVASTTNASSAAVITSGGACSNSGDAVTMTSGTGTCSLKATWAADSHYSGITASQSTSATLVPQVITFITLPPTSAAYGSTFTVAARGGSSGKAVTFTSAGACSNSGAKYTMTNSTGTCSVIANQAGNTDYSAASPVTKTVNALGPLVKLSTSSINFGTLYKGESASQNITVTNIGTEPLIVNDPFFSIVKGGDSSEFSALNFCRWPLAPGKSCTIVINFCAGPYYTLQTATLQIMDNAPGDPQEVSLGALVIDPHVRFDPWNVDFGRVKHGTSSTMNVILRNPGGTPLIFSGAGIGITGQNSADFVETNNCGKSLAAGAECSIAIKFTPTSRGTFCANLTVVDNDRRGGGTQNIQLAGRGD